MDQELTARLNKYLYLARSYLKFILTGKTPAYPLLIQIQTQSLCNGRCTFCPYPVVSQRLPQGTMTGELFKKIIDELLLIKYGGNLLFELHNEPLLDERVFELIRYVKTSLKKVKVHLVSNGHLIHKFILQDISGSGVDKLIISLNALSPEMYRKLNCGIDYDKVIKNIHLLLAEESVKRKITISFVQTREAAEEIPQAVEYWKNLGVKTRIIKLENRAGTLANYDLMTLRSLSGGFSAAERAGKYLIARILGITGCIDPFFHMNILFNGDVILCCDDWNRSTVIGNVGDKPVKYVWNSTFMNRIRRLILRKKYHQISACRQCSKAG